MSKNRLTYDSYELNERDLTIFCVDRNSDELYEFTITDFVPEDYYVGIRYGIEEYEIHDYTPKDWFDECVSWEDLKELVRDKENKLKQE